MTIGVKQVVINDCLNRFPQKKEYYRMNILIFAKQILLDVMTMISNIIVVENKKKEYGTFVFFIGLLNFLRDEIPDIGLVSIRNRPLSLKRVLFLLYH